MKRVVVTGLGLVSPLGCGFENSWSSILKAKSACGPITKFNAENFATKYACEIPIGSKAGEFNPSDWMEEKDRRKVDDFILYGIAASKEAIEDSGWMPKTQNDQFRTGVMIGSGIGGLDLIYKTSLTLNEKGPRRISPFFIPGALINLVSGQVSIRFGLKGPNHSVVTACATGAHAIGDAARLIQNGDAEVMLAGGAENPISELGIGGFNACKALSTKFLESPEKASRPYDIDRDGFVMGEGAGVIVLEEYEHARARKAKIYCEFAGYGLSGDAHHITAPSEDGEGGKRAMEAAINSTNIPNLKIDYINAHGTSTMADTIELRAVEEVVKGYAHEVSMSSTKSSIGHLLGAAGAAEAIFSVLSIRDQIVPPTINLENPAEETLIDLVPKKHKQRDVNIVMSNSFGFGGTNASVLFKKFLS
ncbi:MAG: beta-ketoacyl-ACP synthase II [Paracoccaceae bacterium]